MGRVREITEVQLPGVGVRFEFEYRTRTGASIVA